jgi:hypothetical protein
MPVRARPSKATPNATKSFTVNSYLQYQIITIRNVRNIITKTHFLAQLKIERHISYEIKLPSADNQLCSLSTLICNSGAEGGPLRQYVAPTIQKIRTLITALDFRANGVRKALFHLLAREVRLLGAPIPEGTAEAVCGVAELLNPIPRAAVVTTEDARPFARQPVEDFQCSGR